MSTEYFENLPEARQRAATQVVGMMVIAGALRKSANTAEALKEYAQTKVHPLFNDNRSANLIAQCEAAEATLQAALVTISQVHAQYEMISHVLGEYSPGSESV